MATAPRPRVSSRARGGDWQRTALSGLALAGSLYRRQKQEGDALIVSSAVGGFMSEYNAVSDEITGMAPDDAHARLSEMRDNVVAEATEAGRPHLAARITHDVELKMSSILQPLNERARVQEANSLLAQAQAGYREYDADHVDGINQQYDPDPAKAALGIQRAQTARTRMNELDDELQPDQAQRLNAARDGRADDAHAYGYVRSVANKGGMDDLVKRVNKGERIERPDGTGTVFDGRTAKEVQELLEWGWNIETGETIRRNSAEKAERERRERERMVAGEDAADRAFANRTDPKAALVYSQELRGLGFSASEVRSRVGAFTEMVTDVRDYAQETVGMNSVVVTADILGRIERAKHSPEQQAQLRHDARRLNHAGQMTDEDYASAYKTSTEYETAAREDDRTDAQKTFDAQVKTDIMDPLYIEAGATVFGTGIANPEQQAQRAWLAANETAISTITAEMDLDADGRILFRGYIKNVMDRYFLQATPVTGNEARYEGEAQSLMVGSGPDTATIERFASLIGREKGAATLTDRQLAPLTFERAGAENAWMRDVVAYHKEGGVMQGMIDRAETFRRMEARYGDERIHQRWLELENGLEELDLFRGTMLISEPPPIAGT